MNQVLDFQRRAARCGARRCGVGGRRAWRPLALAAASLFLPPAVLAAGPLLPSGLQVVQGQATVQTNGNAMTVSNSANALLNWQQFSIGAGQAVHFAQPSASSKVLNRVVGSDPSNILGSLSSNGQVWLLNPNGVLFGAGARVDVAGLVASTLRLGDGDWQAGRLRLDGAADGAFGSGASIVNQGELRSTSGGRVLLIASGGVRNEGLIEAPGGQVLLAAGQHVDLIDTATPRLGYSLSAPQGEVLNLGQVLAGGGRIDLQAALVNQQGIVRADGLASGPGGEVLISGSQGAQLGAASLTSASGSGGGRVAIDGGSGSLLAAGRIDVTGTAGTGGSVAMLGRQVGLLDAAVVDASGSAGGGAVRVGGGLRGQDVAYRNADATYLAPGASILADATGAGDGGLVVLWGNQATRAYGSLSARGGPAGGNGGFIETSGGWLDARPRSVRTDAPAGQAGHWLIDPDDITITDDTSDYNIGPGPDFSSTGDGSYLSTSTLLAALNGGSNVSVTTSSGGSGFGDINVSFATLVAAPPQPVTLTLNAIGSILIDSSTVATQGAPLSLVLNAGLLGGNVDLSDGSAHGGAVHITNSSISTGGGNIVIGGPSVACGPVAGCSAAHTGAVASTYTGLTMTQASLTDGISISASTLDAGSGRISLAGHSLVGTTDTAGVALRSGSLLSAGIIDIVGSVDASAYGLQTGVLVDGSSLSATQQLTINGTALADANSYFGVPFGVAVQNGAALTIGARTGSSSATMSITGTSQSGGSASSGIGVSLGTDSQLLALGGASVDINGINNSSPAGVGLVVDTGQAGVFDASAGSALTLHATGTMTLTGALSVPDGGLFSLATDSQLLIDQASIQGAARDVQISGDSVIIGAGGGPASLVFGDNTTVSIKARYFDLGADLASTLGAGAPVGGSSLLLLAGTLPSSPQQQRLSAPDQQAQQLTPPSTQALLAAGGAIQINADWVFIGYDAAIYGAATGTAISLGGFAPSTGMAQFTNQAGSSALLAPNGRWLVYVQDTVAGSSFDPTGLQPDFLQYGAVSGVTVPAQANNGFLFASTPQLTLLGAGTPTKVYDGNTSIDLAGQGFTVGGLLSGQSLVGVPQFGDKNAGTGKALVPATAGGGYSVVTDTDVPVYGYAVDTSTMRGDITPRPLALSSVSVASKVYDGGTAATVTGWTLSGVLTGDDVQVQAGSGQFSDPGVGVAKPVSASVSSLTGADGGNYSSAGLSALGQASITPATLVYLADPLTLLLGQPLPTLTGSVSGFVTGETLASATQGSLRFDAAVSSDSGPGSYAINGSGLSALNYDFVQAPANSTALTLRPAGADDVQAQVNPFVTATALTTVLPPALPSSVGSGRLLDSLSGLLPGGGAQATFAALDLDNLPASTVAAVLAAREAYKKTVFRRALAELDDNPAAADAPGCATPQQAASGQCLIVTPLGNGLDISNARVVERAPIAPSGPAAAPAAAPPAPAPAPAPTVAPAAAAPVLARTLALPPDLSVQLPAPRSVAHATLPQIQRKIAVVIGIDQYRDSRIPRLNNAVADVRAVAAELQSRLGYETLVLENAGRATIFRALNELVGQVGPSDSVVLYYAGHGERSDKTGLGYWLPADADPDHASTWIANTDIDRVLRRLPASQLAMISDSCFSGGLVTGERIRGVNANQDPTELLSRRAAVVMTSGGNEPVFDSGQGGHSPFAYNLMKSLQQLGGWKPGSSLFEQVRFAVARKLPQRPQYGAAPEAGHQAGADYVFEQRQLQAPEK